MPSKIWPVEPITSKWILAHSWTCWTVDRYMKFIGYLYLSKYINVSPYIQVYIVTTAKKLDLEVYFITFVINFLFLKPLAEKL